MRVQDVSTRFTVGPVVALAMLSGAVVWYAAASLFTTAVPSAVAMILFALITFIAIFRFHRSRDGAGFGAANSITYIRAALIAFLGAFAAEPPAPGAPLWWLATATGATALLLDGVDGWVARRTGRMSVFGARFDMEIDALAGLVLCAVLWRAELAGAWVFLIGGMRYVFVGAGHILPWLRTALPPSQRRRAVCASQGFLLVACLLPVLPGWAAASAAVLALFLTAASFLADTLWLYRNRHEPL